MKHRLLLWLMLIPMIGFAENGTTPQDTTLLKNGRKIVIKDQGDKVKIKLYEKSSSGDTIANEQIFEGVYLNGQRSESRTVLNALPFTKSKKSRSRHSFDPHSSGLYIGYMQMSDRFLSFEPSSNVSLEMAHSWEWGFNLFDSHWTLTPRQNWALTFSLGWGYRSMRLDGNNAFRETRGITAVVPGELEDVNYQKSRLRHFFFRIPIMLEGQTRVNRGSMLFFAAGPEAEIRHSVRSKAKVNGDKRTLDKGLHVRPIGVNLLAQAGIGSFGVYMRYSTYGLFEKNKGPEISPFSFGLQWYW